jgi:hypothetical protein
MEKGAFLLNSVTVTSKLLFSFSVSLSLSLSLDENEILKPPLEGLLKILGLRHLSF